MRTVCRVLPDLTAVDRAFDYSVPQALATAVRVGAVVRVPLHGRRVRGWVIADGVDAETSTARLLDVIAVVSAGPTPDVVALSEWVAWRWSGPRAAVLRSASAPNRVAPDSVRAGARIGSDQRTGAVSGGCPRHPPAAAARPARPGGGVVCRIRFDDRVRRRRWSFARPRRVPVGAGSNGRAHALVRSRRGAYPELAPGRAG